MVKSFRSRRVWILAVGVAAGLAAALAPVGQGDTIGGGGGGGYVTVCEHADRTYSWVAHYESCYGIAKLGRWNVWKYGMTCADSKFTVTLKWTIGNPYPEKFRKNDACVDGLDHFTTIQELNPSQMYIDWTSMRGSTVAPDGATVFMGLYR
jgi:hypothetical protein